MREQNYPGIWRDGLWHNNPGLVQLLGLCPLLAVSDTAIKSISLGLATVCVLVFSNTAVSLVRRTLRPEIRLPVFVLIIATGVTAVDLIFQARLYELSLALGIFLPLIVTNCTILARAEAFASHRPLLASLQDGLAQGAGFAAVLIVLGSAREILGTGSLMSDAHLLLGDAAADWKIRLLPIDQGLLLVLMPPGAFIGLGLLVALRQYLVDRGSRESSVVAVEQNA